MFVPPSAFRRVKFIVINAQQIELALRICECRLPAPFGGRVKTF
jgi:hypothetical protein